MITKRLLFIYCCCIVLLSCQEKKRKYNTRKIVSEWIGKEIKFPQGIPCQSAGRETGCIELNGNKSKILVYTDSTGCTSCRIRLPEWKRIIAEADSLFPGKIDFVFVFQPKTSDLKELDYYFKRDRFDHPVFIDTENRMNEINRFPSEMEYQCFLLDPENKVTLIGNPVLNPEVWKLFKANISGEAAAEPEYITKIKAGNTQVYLENMEVGITYTCKFEIENSGDYPFLILDIKTSCGCVLPAWKKQPLTPSDKTEIKVDVTPDEKGFFNKTIHVYGNAVNSPLKLSILGDVK